MAGASTELLLYAGTISQFPMHKFISSFEQSSEGGITVALLQVRK